LSNWGAQNTLLHKPFGTYGESSVLLAGVAQSAWTEPLPKTVGAKLISEVCG